MAGKKTASTYKVMSPAKRKKAVEESLQRKMKNENNFKSLQEEIKNVEKEKKILDAEEKELDERKEEQTQMKETMEKYRKKINTLTYVGKFSIHRNREKITATMKDLRNSSAVLHNLNERISKREATSSKRLTNLKAGFDTLLRENEKTKDILFLLQPVVQSRDRERYEERKEKLMKQISILQQAFGTIVKLDMERQQSPNSHASNIEHFITSKHEALKAEINRLHHQIKVVNEELSQMTALVEQRRIEVAGMKTVIKNQSKHSIEDSKSYKKVLEHNKKLQDKLDEFLTRKDEITAETRRVMKLMEEEKRCRDEKSEKEIEVETIIVRFHDEQQREKAREVEDNKIIDELKRQIEVQDEHLENMCAVSAKLKEQCRNEYNELKDLKHQAFVVGSENQVMLKVISRHVQENLNKLPQEYFNL